MADDAKENGLGGKRLTIFDTSGFVVDTESSAVSFSQLTLKEKLLERKIAIRREAKWIEMLRKWKTYSTSRKEILKRRVRKGIPEKFRSKVWLFLSDLILKRKNIPKRVDKLRKRKKKQKNDVKMETMEQDEKKKEAQRIKQMSYQELLKLPRNEDTVIQIEKDITRTFSNHVLFRGGPLAGGKSAYENDPEEDHSINDNNHAVPLVISEENEGDQQETEVHADSESGQAKVTVNGDTAPLAADDAADATVTETEQPQQQSTHASSSSSSSLHTASDSKASAGEGKFKRPDRKRKETLVMIPDPYADLDAMSCLEKGRKMVDLYNQGQLSLFRVCVAFVHKHPEVGYCQSMAYLGAVILMYLPEEEAYVLLDRLLTSLKYWKYADMYTERFPLLHRFVYIFEQLCKKHASPIYKHFKHLIKIHPSFDSSNILYLSFLAPWLQTFFSSPSFPPAFIIRVWDLFITEGPKILFRVGISILLEFKRDLLQCEMFENAMSFLLHDACKAERLNVEKVIQRALTISIRTSELKKHSREYTKLWKQGKIDMAPIYSLNDEGDLDIFQ